VSSIADEIEAPLPTRLKRLAGELRRMAPPSRLDPERYHVEKDRIATEIARAAVEATWPGSRPRPSLPAASRPRRVGAERRAFDVDLDALGCGLPPLPPPPGAAVAPAPPAPADRRPVRMG
jgi:hypothetical protein